MLFFRIQNNQLSDVPSKMGAVDDNFYSDVNVENLRQGLRGLKEFVSNEHRFSDKHFP